MGATVTQWGVGRANFAVFAMFLCLLALFASTAFAAAPPPAATEAVGEVEHVSGVASSQREGAPARFLGRGDSLFEGDVITTSSTGYLQLSFKDGTKLTIRPNSTFAVDRVRHGGSDESAIFRLLKGGVRAITGLISKRNPQAAEIRTTTATIGIRGTSFDARICESDCAQEEARPGRTAKTAVDDLIVARVAELSGSATATGRDGQARTLSRGTALFSGDAVATAAKSHAVLAFRDETKVTVAADSVFNLEDVRFTGPKMDGGNFLVRITRGSVRALTGLLAKRDPKAVSVRVGTATIGIRGTGFDAGITLYCVTPAQCDQNAIFVTPWQDSVVLEEGGRSIPIPTGATGSFLPGVNTLDLVKSPPVFIDPSLPRPDQINVDYNNLFGKAPQPVGPGLYVGMREGDVVLVAIGGGIIPLATGEVGFLPEGSTEPIRVNFPLFLLNDPTPLPGTTIQSLIVPLDQRKPGSLICEIK